MSKITARIAHRPGIAYLGGIIAGVRVPVAPDKALHIILIIGDVVFKPFQQVFRSRMGKQPENPMAIVRYKKGIRRDPSFRGG